MMNNSQEILAMDLKPRWYAIQTYVGFEDVVKKVLEQKISNISLQDKILEIYIPTNKVVKKLKSGEKKETYIKLYPGYIYVHAILDKEVGYLIQNTQYISRIAGTGDVAVPMDDGYVDKIKQSIIQQEKDANLPIAALRLVVGELVRVKEGPFKDMQGKVCSEVVDGKVNVLLTIFDRETEVELETIEIEKVVR